MIANKETLKTPLLIIKSIKNVTNIYFERGTIK